MGKNFASAFVVCLLVSVLPLACGDDEEGDGGGGGGGKGGSAGSTGGSAGSGARGGSAGAGATGGSSGAGGRGGSSGAAGRGGTGGTGGSAGMTGGEAGMGGTPDNGGMGGVPDNGGMGGEAGSGTPPMSKCEQAFCTVGAGANCTDNSTCEEDCLGFYGIEASCDPLWDALLDCLIAANNPAAFTCNSTSNKPEYDPASAICDTEFFTFIGCLP